MSCNKHNRLPSFDSFSWFILDSALEFWDALWWCMCGLFVGFRKKGFVSPTFHPRAPLHS